MPGEYNESVVASYNATDGERITESFDGLTTKTIPASDISYISRFSTTVNVPLDSEGTVNEIEMKVWVRVINSTTGVTMKSANFVTSAAVSDSDTPTTVTITGGGDFGEYIHPNSEYVECEVALSDPYDSGSDNYFFDTDGDVDFTVAVSGRETVAP